MRLNKGFGLFNFSGDCLLDLNNFKRFSFWPWMWRFSAMFCHAGPSSLAFLTGRIVISKSRRMDCSLNKNYINYGELRCAACFSGDNVSLADCSVIPTLWLGKTMVSVLHATLISCRVGFIPSCFYKSNSSYVFCSSYLLCKLWLCRVLIAAGAFLTDVDGFPWRSQSEFCVVRATH